MQKSLQYSVYMVVVTWQFEWSTLGNDRFPRGLHCCTVMHDFKIAPATDYGQRARSDGQTVALDSQKDVRTVNSFLQFEVSQKLEIRTT